MMHLHIHEIKEDTRNLFKIRCLESNVSMSEAVLFLIEGVVNGTIKLKKEAV